MCRIQLTLPMSLFLADAPHGHGTHRSDWKRKANMTIRRCALIAAWTVGVAAVPTAGFAQSETTYVALGSDPGEIAGNGQDIYIDEQHADIYADFAAWHQRGTITISVRPTDGSPVWTLSFAKPEGMVWALGTFEATGGGDAPSAIIGVSVGGQSCGLRIGRFTVHEVTTSSSGWAAAVDFEARCPNAAAVLYGQVRVYSGLADTSVGQLGMSAVSPVAPGTPLRFAAPFSAGVPLQFKFVRYRVSTGIWEVVQDYSFRSAWLWTPTANDLGDYYLQLWVRDRQSTSSYDEWCAFGPFTISESPPSIISLTSDLPLLVQAGSDITWTVTASGGEGQLAYRFLKYSFATGVWQIARDWSSDPRWVQTASPIDEGLNIVRAEVRSDGAAVAQAAEQAEFQINPPSQSYVLATTDVGHGILDALQNFFPGAGDSGSVGVFVGESLAIEIWASNGHEPVGLVAELSDPGGGAPSVGRHDHAQSTADASAGISELSVDFGPSCPEPTSGVFRVLDAAYSTGGTPTRFAADLERQCWGQRSEER